MKKRQTDEIPPSRIQRAVKQTFNKVFLKHDIKSEPKLASHVWITAGRIHIPVREMSTKHILNCINCWNGKGNMHIPLSYLGGKEKWLRIFNQELIKRN